MQSRVDPDGVSLATLTSMAHLRVAGAQLDLIVGDLTGNRDQILEAMAWAEEQEADVLLLPELAITGYPPEDLLHRTDFVAANLEILDTPSSRRFAVAAKPPGMLAID